jgi:hypothetical protein
MPKHKYTGVAALPVSKMNPIPATSTDKKMQARTAIGTGPRPQGDDHRGLSRDVAG